MWDIQGAYHDAVNLPDYRRSLGLPAVSVGLGMISEVGYLHENPEIEALLLRKGIQPIPESEFLTVIDVALSTSSLPEKTYINHDYGYDEGASAHILTPPFPQGAAL